jgi:hypothetical protein
MIVERSDRTRRILEIIQDVSDELHVFVPRGQGAGNVATNNAVRAINTRVANEVGADILQCILCSGNKQSVDFFLKDEAIVIELEYSLKNPYPCLEKDLFKILLAKDAGVAISDLVLVGDPGSQKRLSAPAPRAIIEFVKRVHGVTVSVIELRPRADGSHA